MEGFFCSLFEDEAKQFTGLEEIRGFFMS
jgi:hypothetical protein